MAVESKQKFLIGITTGGRPMTYLLIGHGSTSYKGELFSAPILGSDHGALIDLNPSTKNVVLVTQQANAKNRKVFSVYLGAVRPNKKLGVFNLTVVLREQPISMAALTPYLKIIFDYFLVFKDSANWQDTEWNENLPDNGLVPLQAKKEKVSTRPPVPPQVQVPSASKVVVAPVGTEIKNQEQFLAFMKWVGVNPTSQVKDFITFQNIKKVHQWHTSLISSHEWTPEPDDVHIYAKSVKKLFGSSKQHAKLTGQEAEFVMPEYLKKIVDAFADSAVKPPAIRHSNAGSLEAVIASPEVNNGADYSLRRTDKTSPWGDEDDGAPAKQGTRPRKNKK